MNLWWFGLATLALPVWLHRQKRERVKAHSLATARFLPHANPQQNRVWYWVDKLLLLVRCLLLASLVAWLADPVLPWRGDAVIITPGTDAAWAEQQIKESSLQQATRITQPDPLRWLAAHESEWRPSARLLVLGDVPMPAAKPSFQHAVELRAKLSEKPPAKPSIGLTTDRPEAWQAYFKAIDVAPKDLGSDICFFDRSGALPANAHCALWLTNGTAQAQPTWSNLLIADTSNGRQWTVTPGPGIELPPKDPHAARLLLATVSRLHTGVAPYSSASQSFSATPAATNQPASGALQEALAYVLLVLFALERLLAHASRR